MDRITVQGLRFIDERARERIFNGVNIVDKSDYSAGEQRFYTEITDEMIAGFIDKGINIIRLGFTWAKLEPVPGEYNDAYLDDIERIVDKFAQNNIYVYLDMHQDLYAPACYGDGAPAWACITDGAKAHPMKLVWAEGYFWGKAVHKAFDNFWTNREYNGKGLLEYFADCWAHIIKRFADKENIFGYDFLNEPFPGTDGGRVFRLLIAKLVRVTLFDKGIDRKKLISDALHSETRHKVLDHYDEKIFPKIVSAGAGLIYKFDTERYSPFLDRMGTAARRVTDKGILFADNCYYSNLGIPCSISPIKADGVREPNQCFEPHGYDIMVDTPEYKYANNGRVGTIFDEHRRTQLRLNVPVIVGEWGGFGGEGRDWLPHIAYLLDKFDSNKWSNTYWHHCDGFTETLLMEVFCRPYPKATAGEVIQYKTYRAESRFTLAFEQKESDADESVIFVPSEVKELSVDGKKVKPVMKGRDLCIKTKPGKHTVLVKY